MDPLDCYDDVNFISNNIASHRSRHNRLKNGKISFSSGERFELGNSPEHIYLKNNKKNQQQTNQTTTEEAYVVSRPYLVFALFS